MTINSSNIDDRLRKRSLFVKAALIATAVIVASAAVPFLLSTDSSAARSRLTEMLMNDVTLEAESRADFVPSRIKPARIRTREQRASKPQSAPRMQPLVAQAFADMFAESKSFPVSTVYAMGDNAYGQLGIGSATDTNVPAQVGIPEYGGPFAIGVRHMMVTDSSATLWASGDDNYGQFGDGLSNSGTTSIFGPLNETVTSVSLGLYHTLIVKEDGTVYGAGDGNTGQLGNGGNSNASWELIMSDADKVVANGSNSYVITNTGELWVFGKNTYGQLGTGSVSQVNTPTKVIASGVVDVSVGFDHALVLMDDGSVMAMGQNNYGQFGDGTTGSSTLPLQVIPQGVKQVGAGQQYSIFRMADGTVRGVGFNDYGQLATGDTAARNILTPLPVTDAADIAVGNTHTMILRTTGALLGVGNNADGQLGLGDFSPRVVLDTAVSSGVAEVVAGANSTMYATRTLSSIGIEGLTFAYENSTANYDCHANWSDGRATVVTAEATWWVEDNNATIDANSGVLHIPESYDGRRILVHCSYMGLETSFDVWVQSIPLGSAMYGHGANAYSQLGLDSTVDFYTAQNVTMDKVISMAGGLNHSLFVKQDGTVWSMGDNTYGQLGTGDTVPQSLPVQVMTGPAVWVGAGDYHSLAVMRDGSLWSFGLNSEGQLGEGTQTNQTSAQLVHRSGVTMANGGAGHSVYLTSGGAVFTMGRNLEGQLGDGTTGGSNVPHMAHNANATYISAGKYHTIFGTDDTALWGMGDNSRGQLGLSSTITSQLSPTTLKISGVSQAEAGYLHTAYISMAGDLFTTGANDNGELGQGTVGTDAYGFAQVTGFTNVTEVGGGSGFTFFRVDETTLYAMGDRSNGRFGNGLAGFTINPEELPHTNVAEMGFGFGHVLYTQRTIGSVEVRGLYAVIEGKSANYDCYVHWDNGDVETVTDSATWGEDQAFTTITTNGILSIEPSTAGQTVNVSVNYSSSSDSMLVYIQQGELQSLNLDGAGKNDSYQIGDPTDTTPHSTLYTIDTSVAEIASGSAHTMFIRGDGSLWGVGSNSYGQLGTGDTTTRSAPVQIATDVVEVTCGLNHTLFVTVDGSLWVMGDNYDGQLGTGDNAEIYTPYRVYRSGVVEVEAGSNFSLFKTADQDLFGMGSNASGQLGLAPDHGGTIPTATNTPSKITSGVSEASAGYSHTLFLRGTELWGMGANNDGQLGLGYASSIEQYPQLIANQIQDIATGDYHSLFITDTMELMSVGYNLDGQLGTSDTISRSTPVLIDTSVVELMAGGNHSLWIRSDSTAYGAGNNFYGQLAQGAVSAGESTPRMITDVVESLGAGSYTSFFLREGVTLVEIIVSGPTGVNENDSATYTCTAYYSDSSTVDVSSTATWYVDSAVGSFSANVLSTTELSADTTTSVGAEYQGFTDSQAVTIYDTTPVITHIIMGGPTSVNELDTATYTCTAYFDDSSTQNVSTSATWYVDSGLGSFVTNVLTAAEVAADTSGYVGCEYSGFTDSQTLTVVDTTPVLLSILATGPTTMNENDTATFTCTATYSDSSTADVSSTTTWSVDTGLGSFNVNVLTAAEVASDTTATVTATYSSFTDTTAVTIVDTTPVLLSLLVSGPTSVNEFDTAAYSCTATYSDSSTYIVTDSTTWSIDTAGSFTGNILTADSVAANTAANITANYSGLTDTYPVTIVHIPPVLTAVSIFGPSEVPEEDTAVFNCIGIYDDASTQPLPASWAINTGGSFTNNVLTTDTIAADLSAIVSTTYGAFTDTQAITIVNVPAPLVGITIQAPAHVFENTTTALNCIALFADNTTKNVTDGAYWAENSPYATIGENTGSLVTSELVGDWPVTVTVSYGPYTETKAMTIIDDDPMTRIYVKADATGVNNGTSWTNAFTDLQKAFPKSTSGTQVWIAAGTYKPTSGGNRLIAFRLVDGVELYGGFAGTETTLGDRAPATNVTILSGQINDQTLVGDNSLHVLVGATGAIVDGFTIRDGAANAPPDDRNCGPDAWEDGESYGPDLRESATYTAEMVGGGLICLNGDDVTVRNCIFTNNFAIYGGGAVYNRESSSTFSSCRFVSNRTSRWGGAMFNTADATPSISDSIFQANHANASGGAMMSSVHANPGIHRVTFKSNTAGRDGGACIFNYSTPTVVNCVFYLNTASHGGAIIVNDTNLMLKNCTVSRNAAELDGGAIEANASTVNVVNSIIWNNSSTEGLAAIHPEWGSTINLSYSCIDDSEMTGTGVINTDPLFTDAATNDYSLQSTSPCINTSSPVSVALDILRRSRADGQIDMGAYEYGATTDPGSTPGPNDPPTTEDPLDPPSTGGGSSGSSSGCGIGPPGGSWLLPILLLLASLMLRREFSKR